MSVERKSIIFDISLPSHGGMNSTIRARVICTFVVISFALSILSVPTTTSSDSRISCVGTSVGTNLGTTLTHWTVTINAISGGDRVALNTTYLAVWTSEGKLTVPPATLDKFESQSPIDLHVRYFANSNPNFMTPGDVFAFNKSTFALGCTMKLLLVSSEKWYEIARISVGSANISNLDPLPSLVNYGPQILAIVLVALAAISIWIASGKWEKMINAKDQEERENAIKKWMPPAFMIAGVLLLCLGFYSFPAVSPMMFYLFPLRGQLYCAIFIIAAVLCGFAASLEYSKWKRKIGSSKLFLSYLLLSIAVLIISIGSILVTMEGVGGPAC